ncbi:hypothetical protein F183_A49740 [Bryobacterales bacterium F-183]|nr:hypothetical protein F183_A49740 [Bryobacterales bacterium F-183]
MAGLRPVLGALRKAWGRSAAGIRSVTGNNMTYLGFTLLFMMAPSAMVFFSILMALVLFLPSSGDPLALIPAERFALWPLPERSRWLLRLVTPWLNPLAWLMVAGLIWKRVGFDLWAAVTAIFLLGFFASHLPGQKQRLGRPWFASVGPMGQIAKLHLRQIRASLDFWCALLLAVPSLGFRLAGRLDAAADLPLTLVILIILSTIGVTLFGMDGAGGLTRFALWPLAGWRVLFAKGVPFVGVAVACTLHLAPLAAFGGALLLLAVGHFRSLAYTGQQMRWRFRAGHGFAMAMLQMVSAILAASAVDRFSKWALLVCLAIYGALLWWCGRRLSQRMGWLES